MLFLKHCQKEKGDITREKNYTKIPETLFMLSSDLANGNSAVIKTNKEICVLYCIFPSELEHSWREVLVFDLA